LKEKCIAVIWGPFINRVAHLYIAVAVGPHLKARQATLHVTVAKGGPRQVPRLPSLKHTTVYDPDNDLI